MVDYFYEKITIIVIKHFSELSKKMCTYVSQYGSMVRQTRYFVDPLDNNSDRLPLFCERTELQNYLREMIKFLYADYRTTHIVFLSPI